MKIKIFKIYFCPKNVLELFFSLNLMIATMVKPKATNRGRLLVLTCADTLQVQI